MGKNKVWMIIIIAVLALMLCAVGFGFVYLSGQISSNNNPNSAGDRGEKVSSFGISDIVQVPVTEAIKVNLLPGDDGVEHYALIEMSVAVYVTENKDAEKIQKELVDNEIIVRHTTIEILRNKTYQDLKMPNAQQNVSRDVLNSLQDIFKTNSIVEVYFGEFFLQ